MSGLATNQELTLYRVRISAHRVWHRKTCSELQDITSFFTFHLVGNFLTKNSLD